MEETTTSSGAGATPAPGSPATGNASGGATPASKPATTLEEAMARIAELERHAANKDEQATRHGKALTQAEKELAAYKEKERLVQEAALSEAQKLEKRAAEAEQTVQQYKQQLITAQVRLAAQSKGIIDPDLAALAIQSQLEFGEDGMPTNVEKALDALVKQKPYLAPAPKPAEATEPPATPAQTATPPAIQTPAIPAMNPGRTSIQQPGQLPPGKRWTLDDYFKSKP
jgi:hypothetical protein